MMLNLKLIPEWRSAWRFLSVKAAALLVFISAVREIAQQNVEDVPALAFIAHAHWYAPTMAILGVAIALLRLVHQPVATTSDSAVPDLPAAPGPVYAPGSPITTTGDTSMNSNIASLLSFVIRLVVGAQQISNAQATPLTGPEKKEVAIALAHASVDASDTSKVGTAIAMIDSVVSALKPLHDAFAPKPPSGPGAV